MSLLLAVAQTVVATPVPTPSPVVVQKVIEHVKEVPVTPAYINQLLFTGALLVVGYVGSWLQAFVNARRKLAEKVNIAVTAFYTFAGAAVVLYQQGQLDLSNPAGLVSSAAVVLLAAWVRHNGGKLTQPTVGADMPSDGAFAADEVIPTKASV